MTIAPRERPTLVLSLFDQKETAAKVRKANLGHDASGLIRYLMRLDILPGPYDPPRDLVRYIVRDGAVAAVAFGNFNCMDLAGRARELEGDLLRAKSVVKTPLVHGCFSVSVSPENFEGKFENLVKLTEEYLQLQGVDKNRYIIAVHVDSDHIHVHFLYSRIGPEGELRERDRRQPKFMAEEACAFLAYKYGFDLEDRHLSRVIDGQIVDLASGFVVRDQNFDEKPAGMKRRNEAREKVGKDELYKLALVGNHIAQGNLDTFRRHLAKHGYLYEPAGTGAEFERLDGSRSAASHLDYRFSKGRILDRAYATDLPPTPSDIVQLARSRRPVPHDADAEFERVIADRSDSPPEAYETTADRKAKDRWDRAVKAAMKEDRRGRPLPAPELPGWPRSMHVEGVLGATSRKRGRMIFPQPYQVQERDWQTEVWSGSTLIATVRYSRMAILSKRDEDLRASLLAAKAAWGTVEIIGNAKFKQRMAALAAELGVPISNPELADTMAIARKREKPLPPVTHPAAGVAQSAQVRAEIPQRAGANSDNAMAQATGGTTRGMSAAPNRDAQAKAPEIATQADASPTPGRSASPLSEKQNSAPKTVPIQRSKASTAFNTSAQTARRAMLIESAERNNWEVITTHRPHGRTLTLKPSTMSGFGIAQEDLTGPAMQTRLKVLHDQQQLDHVQILELVSRGLGTLSPIPSPYRDDPHRVRVETNNRPLLDLISRCEHHDALHHLLYEFHQQQLCEREEAKRKRRLERVGGNVSHTAVPLVEVHGVNVQEDNARRDLAGADPQEKTPINVPPDAVDAGTGGPLTRSLGPQGILNGFGDTADQNRTRSAEVASASEPGEASSFERPDENQGQLPPDPTYAAALEAALAEMRRPRALGEGAKTETAFADKPVANAASPERAKGSPHPVSQETPRNGAGVDPSQEAAKAASALGKEI